MVLVLELESRVICKDDMDSRLVTGDHETLASQWDATVGTIVDVPANAGVATLTYFRFGDDVFDCLPWSTLEEWVSGSFTVGSCGSRWCGRGCLRNSMVAGCPVGRECRVKGGKGFVYLSFSGHEVFQLEECGINNDGVALGVTGNEARVRISEAGEDLEWHAFADGDASE